MIKDIHDYSLFSGLILKDSKCLPDDLTIDLSNIRKWAYNNNLVFDPASQFMGEERLTELCKHFTQEDGLSLLINITKDKNSKLLYVEYVYFPVKLLIKRAKQIDIVYWEVKPTHWDSSRKPIEYTEIYFGFWYPVIDTEEFISMSTSKSIVTKFHNLYHELSRDFETEQLEDGTLDITVNGAIKATFNRIGRSFDVVLSK